MSMEYDRHVDDDDADDEKSSISRLYADDIDLESVTSEAATPSDLPDTLTEVDSPKPQEPTTPSTHCNVLARACGYLTCLGLIVLATLAFKYILKAPQLDSTPCTNGVAVCPLTGVAYPCDPSVNDRVTCVRYDMCRPGAHVCGLGDCEYDVTQDMYVCECTTGSKWDEAAGICVKAVGNVVDSTAGANVNGSTGDGSSSLPWPVDDVSSTASAGMATVDSSSAVDKLEGNTSVSMQYGLVNSTVDPAISSTTDDAPMPESSSSSLQQHESSSSSRSATTISSSVATASSSSALDPSSSLYVLSSSLSLSSSSLPSSSSNYAPSSSSLLDSSSSALAVSSSASVSSSAMSSSGVSSSSSAAQSSTSYSSSATPFAPPPMSFTLTTDFTQQPCIGYAVYTDRISHALLYAHPSKQAPTTYFLLLSNAIRVFDTHTYYTTVHTTQPYFTNNHIVISAERDQVLYLASVDCTSFCMGAVETSTWLVGNKVTVADFTNCGVPSITTTLAVLSMHTDNQGNVIVTVFAPPDRIYITMWSRRLTSCIFAVLVLQRRALPRAFYDEDANAMYLAYVDGSIARISLNDHHISTINAEQDTCQASTLMLQHNEKWLWLRQHAEPDVSLVSETRSDFTDGAFTQPIACSGDMTFSNALVLVDARMTTSSQIIGIGPQHMSILYNQTKLVVFTCVA